MVLIEQINLEQLKAYQQDRQWIELFDRAYEQTPYQSPAFITTWFAYYPEYAPIKVYQENNNGELTALLWLAKSSDDQIYIAGQQQAEYQHWLQVGNSNHFLKEAIPAIFNVFPTLQHLKFKYITQPLVEKSLLEIENISFKQHKRPLVTLDVEQINKSFRKKSNKSKINRLARLGEITFTRITHLDAFSAIFDEIITYYDARQGAANNSFPFSDDANKKAFHLAMFDAGLLHTTVLTVDNQMVAAHIGLGNEQKLHLAILAMSPFFSAHSPGKLHIMHLNRLLAEAGVLLFDLTPGGDPWKDRFANNFDTVYEVSFYRNKRQALLVNSKEQFIKTSRQVLQKMGVEVSTIKKAVKWFSHITPRKIITKFTKKPNTVDEFRVYRIKRSSLLDKPSVASASEINNIEHLLSFKPAESWQTRQTFMNQAIHRIESGQQVYSIAKDHQLIHYGWLQKSAKESFFTEVGKPYSYPEHSAVLYDFYSMPNARGKGLYQSNIEQMLAQIQHDETIEYIYISVLADNKPSRRVIEKLGFEYIESLTGK